jgi:hypothetical protein
MPTLNYQFGHHEATIIHLALGVVLRQFENCRDGEAPQMIAYINQPSWSEASQAARTMIERLSAPRVVVTINAPYRASTVYGVDKEMQQLGTAAVHLRAMAPHICSISRNNATFPRALISEPRCCIVKIRQLWRDIVAPHFQPPVV